MSRPLSVQELRDVLAAARVNRVGTIRDLVVQFNGDEDKARSFYNETPDFELYALASGPKNPATLLIVKSYDVQVNQPLRIQIVSPFENMGREAFCRPADLVPAPIDLYQEQLEVLKGSRVSITNRAELDQFLDAAFERRAQTKEEVAEAALSKEEGRTFYETHKDFYLWGFASRADGNSYTRTASGALGVILGYYPKSQEVRVRIIAAAPGYNLRSDNEFTIKAHVLRKASRDDFGAVQDGEAPAKAEEVSKAVSL